MKKISLILVLMLSISAFAQDRKQERKQDHKMDRVEMSADEMATLRTKKMALKLDLTEEQQARLKTLFSEEATYKKTTMAQHRAMKKDTATWNKNRFAIQNARLDHQKEMQDKIKTILTPEQFETWKASSDRSGKKMKMHRKNKNK
ncbi:MAG: Spy/CpxP family protein refolding chaperone [Gillisia sp.]